MPSLRRQSALNDGFTFMEVLVVSALLSVVLGVIMLTVLTGQRSYTSTEAFVQVQEEARRALDMMTQELHGGVPGTIGLGTNQITFQYVLGYNLTAPCPLNDICPGALDAQKVKQFGWSVRYRLVGTQLRREILDPAQVPQLGTRVLANHVSQVTFANPSSQVITIQLVVQRISGQLAGGSMAMNPAPLMTTVNLRN